MSYNLIKKSTVAAAVAGALFSVNAQAVNVADLVSTSKYDGKKVEMLKEQQAQAVSWLVELKQGGVFSASDNDRAAVQSQVTLSQARVESAIKSADLNLTIIGKTSKLVNAVIVNGQMAEVEKLLANEDVKEIYPVRDYQLDVADAAEYIKATPLVASGKATGEGIKVAVLDTGIDYTHKFFGGAGTQEAYDAAVADQTNVDWPQGQVKGGYDFINNDPNPIDINTNHGTHVSHSVTGIAPNVELYVYSVCQRRCPGVAQLRALEAAMDPNGDGNIKDRVDVINMSLGGDYGRVGSQDAVSLFINKAAKLGTNVVISAGNDGGSPFIVGGPSTTENALSVGAMTNPARISMQGSGTVNGKETVVQGASFGPKDEFTFTSDTVSLVYPDANQNGCEAFASDVDFTDKAVVIDRGACAFTQKVLNAQAKGAKFVIIANNVDDGTPAPMGGSDENVTIPSVGVNFETGKALKEAGATFEISAKPVTTKGAIASFTSRGPTMNGLLKPEITAPGTGVMTAHPGTGDGMSPATGTSFSSPITAGAMSLLKQALPERNGLELKATLMNAADLDVTMLPRETNPDTALAPISYIGAGLVDVEKAANLPVAAWEKSTKQAALSFGLNTMSEVTTFTKTVEVKNFSNEAKTYEIALEQRFADDKETGALSMDFPSSITVPAGQTVSFDVVATVDPAKLYTWVSTDDAATDMTLTAANLNNQYAGAKLTKFEFDGALIFNEGGAKAFHLVYHMLPKAAGKPDIAAQMSGDKVQYMLTNNGAADFEPLIVSTVASDPAGDAERFDLVAGSVETIPFKNCDSGYGVFTTIAVEQPISHTYDGGFFADFDMDSDGTWDVTAQGGKLEWFYNFVPSGTAITFTHAYDVLRGSLNGLYQQTGSNFVVLQSCLADFGLKAEDLGKAKATVRFRTESSPSEWTPTASVDEAIGTYTFAPAKVVAALVTDGQAQGQTPSGTAGTFATSTPVQVDKLAPGESAQLLFADSNFTLLSTAGSKAVLATPSADAQAAPSLANAEFSVEEKAAVGTVIGQLAASTTAPLAAPISEYIVTSSSSTAVTVNENGEVVVADSAVLDYAAGLKQVDLQVVAVDTKGNLSDEAMVKVMVKAKPAPKPVEPVKEKRSSGSLAWLTLLLAPLAVLRRRKR